MLKEDLWNDIETLLRNYYDNITAEEVWAVYLVITSNHKVDGLNFPEPD